MIDHALRFTLPAAYALLPPVMATPAASALLLTIGLQESGFLARRQGGTGPARGFWEFERGGVAGILKHPLTKAGAAYALSELRYARAIGNPSAVLVALEHNDTLAAVFARLLLWTLPAPLPDADHPRAAWQQYLDAWRPGAPHLETWDAYYVEAWTRVEAHVANITRPVLRSPV
jgi:hypothetical protein